MNSMDKRIVSLGTSLLSKQMFDRRVLTSFRGKSDQAKGKQTECPSIDILNINYGECSFSYKINIAFCGLDCKNKVIKI